ncbi:MAG: hypothetical protein V4463_03320 [Pseudomonadota bacterium]
MPIFGLGIHVIIAIFFAIHAVRSGRELYWLIILFSFPLLGSVVYFFVVFLPSSRLEHGLRKAGAAVQKSLDPNRELREAQQAFDLTPTAQNQMRLAAAQMEAGHAAQAVEQYEACLRGPFAQDMEIRFGAARARLANAQPDEAIALLQALRAQSANFQSEQLGLLLAQALAAAGRHAEAEEAFQSLLSRFAGLEVRIEYALWAIGQGKGDSVAQVRDDIAHARRHMARHTVVHYKELFARYDAVNR